MNKEGIPTSNRSGGLLWTMDSDHILLNNMYELARDVPKISVGMLPRYNNNKWTESSALNEPT